MDKQTREKYAYLDQLSTQRLEELLLADLEDESGRDTSQVVFHILEVLRKREDTPAEIPDVDQAWERFQRYYNTPEGKDRSLYPSEMDQTEGPAPTSKRSHPSLWKTVRIAAATVALLLALMVGAQASGLNVFGALAQWTSETFHFGGGQSEVQSENYQLFLDELSKNQIPKEYAPTWIPSGFVASKPTVRSDDESISILISFSNAEGNIFNINIDRYMAQTYLENKSFEKSDIGVESYLSCGKTFYIFSNIDSITATWAEGTISETIWGNLSDNEIKSIIDSIGGS